MSEVSGAENPVKVKRKGRPKEYTDAPPDLDLHPAIDATLPPQLGAMRAAASWGWNALPDTELVRFFVKLKRRQPGQFSVQWERLEKEFAKVLPAAQKPSPPAGASLSESRPLVSPAVEEDVVGEKLEGMIEAWLAETGKRVAGTCPCCGQKVPGGK